MSINRPSSRRNRPSASSSLVGSLSSSAAAPPSVLSSSILSSSSSLLTVIPAPAPHNQLDESFSPSSNSPNKKQYISMSSLPSSSSYDGPGSAVPLISATASSPTFLAGIPASSSSSSASSSVAVTIAPMSTSSSSSSAAVDSSSSSSASPAIVIPSKRAVITGHLPAPSIGVSAAVIAASPNPASPFAVSSGAGSPIVRSASFTGSSSNSPLMASPNLLRTRMDSDSAPWDEHDDGVTTYLPAASVAASRVAAASPTPGSTSGTAKKVRGSTPINGPAAAGGARRSDSPAGVVVRVRTPAPTITSLNPDTNKAHVISMDESLLTQHEQRVASDSASESTFDHNKTSRISSRSLISRVKDEIHADDLNESRSRFSRRGSESHYEPVGGNGGNGGGDPSSGGSGDEGADGDAGYGENPSDDHDDGEHDDGVDETVDEGVDIPSYRPPPVSHSHKLGQWMSTGICGNDITSSCLYVTGLCVADAGIWAPICLLMVAFTLYLFRKIYGEAVTALPLNGGAYNVLLNTTSKSTAAVAACLTILSYVATAVVSGSTAINYLHILWEGLNVTLGTIVLLSVFAFLNLMGISDSALVALIIFITHILTMAFLAIVTIVHIGVHGFDMLIANYHFPLQPVLWRSIVYGFSSAMLGVSGFESSANFVEEQKEGVFVKTLRNMWVCVSIINPLLSFLALCVIEQAFIINPDNQATVLAEMGKRCGGVWLEKLVSVDAFLVLSGGVLTSFVGVVGLCRRLALDRCLPQFLLAENEWRHTNHWIIIGFLGICASMYLILNGDVTSLANVYSISFLSVMGLFAVGNMLLKYKRGRLKREVTAPWAHVFLALGLICLAMGGLLGKDPSILVVWFLYFLITGGLVATMFFRVQTLKLLYAASKALCGRRSPRCLDAIANTIKSIGGQSIGFFAKSGKMSTLNKAILYVRANEDCAWIRIIHVYDAEENIPTKLLRNVHILDECYPKIKIDLVLVPGIFSPDVIDYLSQQLQIPKNLMFITCPTENFSLKIETLGGVRLITH